MVGISLHAPPVPGMLCCGSSLVLVLLSVLAMGGAMIPVPLLIFGVAAVALASTAAVDRLRLRRSGYQPWRRAPIFGVGYQFSPDSSSTFRAAGAHPPLKLSLPRLVRLQFDHAWAHLYGIGGLIDVWIPRDQIIEVRSVRLSTCTAVRFLSTSGDFDGVLFESFTRTSLLAALRTHGWPVADR